MILFIFILSDNFWDINSLISPLFKMLSIPMLLMIAFSTVLTTLMFSSPSPISNVLKFFTPLSAKYLNIN